MITLTKGTLKKVVEKIKQNKVLNPRVKPEKKKENKLKKDQVKLRINVLKRLPASDIVKIIYMFKETKQDFVIE
jgi:hypothetical protein